MNLSLNWKFSIFYINRTIIDLFIRVSSLPNADWSNRRRGGRRHLLPPSVCIYTTSALRQYTGPAADASLTPTDASTGTARPRRVGAACGGGGDAAGAAYGTGCVAADCSHFETGTGRVRAGGGQAAVAPEKAAAASLPAAVGHEAARCRPWHLVVAEERCQCRKAVRGEMVGRVSDVPGRHLAGSAIKSKNAINA